MRFRVVLAAIFLVVARAASAEPLNLYNGARHLGAATCGGSTCHQSPTPWMGSMVLQNEFSIWSTQDRHSRSYRSLLTPRAQRIAKNLGISAPAQSPSCLNCHADNVALEMQSRQFSIADGVSCEVCHGGAENWLGQHVSGSGYRASNVAVGMFPTHDPLARGTLCLSCHQGDQSRQFSHRLLGAGHPRLRFELDTYIAAQPAHFRVDASYVKRKGGYSNVQNWAIGLSLQVENAMEALSRSEIRPGAATMDFGLFECSACHRNLPMSDTNSSGRLRGLGEPRLQTANIVLMQLAADGYRLSSGIRLKGMEKSLLDAVRRGDAGSLRSIAKVVAGEARDLAREIAAASLDFDPTDELLDRILHLAAAGAFDDFGGAEQVVMSVTAILSQMARDGKIVQKDAAASAMENLYRTVDDVTRFDSTAYRLALTGIGHIAIRRR
jgi:hypothetical protein